LINEQPKAEICPFYEEPNLIPSLGLVDGLSMAW